MGKILQKALLQNAITYGAVKEGYIDVSKIKEIEVEFLVDTGAAMVCLPPDIISKLKLYSVTEKNAKTAAGMIKRKIYSPVRINILGREANFDVMEVSSGAPPIIRLYPITASRFNS